MTKIYLVYGQGGKFLSPAFVIFASRLRGLGYKVDDHYNWRQYQELASDIFASKEKKVAVIGYSMGAWAGAMACSYAIEVDLLVGYDMSGGWGFFTVSKPPPIGSNVKRCLHYAHGGPDLFRSMPYEGKRVEHIRTGLPHALIQGSEDLHKITLGALKKLEGT